jgi:hypothetical protein
MAQRTTHEALLISAINSGKTRTTHESILISVTAPLVAITYPISPPAINGLGPQDVVMRTVNAIGETESPFTFSQQEQQWQGERLEIDANLPPLTLAEGEQWVSFLVSLFGKYGTFLMGDYARQTPQGPMSGTPVVSGSNYNAANQLNIRGAAASVANWAIAGDYIQITSAIGAPQRLYKILQNASSNAGGDVTVQIFPNIRETLSDGVAIITQACAGTFRLVANSTEWKIEPGNPKKYTISFKAKEAI